MSRLFFSETGRLLYLENEELASYRRARKVFRLPAGIQGGATLFLLAKSRRGCRRPLRVQVNGRRTLSLAPKHVHYLSWFALHLGAGDIRGGTNVIEIWSDNDALDGWILGLEPCVRKPDSALSLDGGRTWQSNRMGVHHCLRGEYVIRLRLDDPELSDPPPPARTWEKPDCPRFAALTAAIPRRIGRIEDPWQRARALATWVCSWSLYRMDRARKHQIAEYCPWEPLTIRAWLKADFGQYQANPVAFCVHYGAAFVSLALALGLPARCVCGTGGTLERGPGHFIAEVWIEKWRKWCYLDPMCDFAFLRNSVPLSTAELAEQPALRLLGWLSRGPGFFRLPRPTRMMFKSAFGTGICFRHWALWPRNDFLSHPELTPPSHGAVYYCETDWLWAKTGRASQGMFPWHVPADLLAKPPPAGWRALRRECMEVAGSGFRIQERRRASCA
jgi:hypothetical protein